MPHQLAQSSEPWTAYNALLDLDHSSHNDPALQTAYQAMQAHLLVADLISSLDTWPTAPLSKAYDPKDAIWKLSILADFGLTSDDPRIAAIAERLFAAQSEEGGFLHGGFDHTKTWNTRPYICIDHVQTYALARFGYLDDPRLVRAYDHIQQWQRLDGGWHPNALNLPGNPREAEPSCPFGTANVLRAVLANHTLRETPIAHRAANFLLDCYARRDEPFRPIGFGIGSSWHKLQYPIVQYALLKAADTLSLVPNIADDSRFQQMLTELDNKRTPTNQFIPESINKPYADFSFGQKKLPSDWLTFLITRIHHRTQLPTQ